MSETGGVLQLDKYPDILLFLLQALDPHDKRKGLTLTTSYITAMVFDHVSPAAMYKLVMQSIVPNYT